MRAPGLWRQSLGIVVAAASIAACSLSTSPMMEDDSVNPVAETKTEPVQDPYTAERKKMVEEQLRNRDINSAEVLRVMATTPRHLFVPETLTHQAYLDHPLPIGHRQTISQPYIVALMTQLGWKPGAQRVLDIGTGSGYQAAVLAGLVKEVYSIEIICPLADSARERLHTAGYNNVTVRCGDGYQGWIEHAPFDFIIVAAAPDHIPEPLKEQLAPGGRLIIPVGNFYQELIRITRTETGEFQREDIVPVRFVPMTGEAQKN